MIDGHAHLNEIAPIEHLLVETDAPVAHQGKASEPSDLLVTLRALSRIRGLEVAVVSRDTEENTRSLFRI